MFKIRIDVKGFDRYNGLLGTVEFENGVSVREVTQEELNRLGAIMKMVRVDTDEQVGHTTNMVRNKKVEARSAPSYTPKEKEPEKVEEAPVVKINENKHTKESLEAIADKEGIKGVRKVAEEFGVKGVQISALIEGILAEQSKED